MNDLKMLYDILGRDDTKEEVYTTDQKKRYWRSQKGQYSKTKGLFNFLQLIKDWESIVGPMMAKNTVPLKVKSKTLFISTKHAIFAQELGFLTPVINTTTSTNTESGFGDNVLGKNREDFVIPSSNSINMYLRIIVIKHPTNEEIKFLQTEYGDKALSSKIIFNERMSLSTVYSLKQYEGESISVLGTQNEGLFRQSIDLLAKKAADNFRDMILYAF